MHGRRGTTTFHGRARELEALHALFEAGDTLVTVVGPAGIGKTRFVTRYAEQWADRTSGEDEEARSVSICDLTEARDEVSVLGAMGRALDVPLVDESLERISEVLADRGRALVVLDNCEQVAGDVAAIVSALRAKSPATQWLTTSRELLRLSGERAFELPPLADAMGVALFVDRAQLVRADYRLDDDAELVAEIVRALDGLPLAIELAAARMGVLDARGIRERLSSRLDLLSAGPRDVSTRQRTLRGALDGSWQLLGPAEQAALRQCAVFSSGFTVDDAEGVLQLGGASVLDALHALRDKSLLHARSSERALRLGMLESIRDYALEKLDASGERAATRERHARHFIELGGRLAAEVFRHGGAARLQRLGDEVENLHAAHAHALERGHHEDVLRAMLALVPPMSLRGPFERYLALLDATIEATEGAPHDGLRAEVLIARAWARWPYGLVDAARADLDLAIDRAKRAGSIALEARALAHRATLENHAGHPDEARALCLRALPMLQAVGDVEHEATVLGDLGVMALDRGRNEEALDYSQRALAASRRVGHRAHEARYLSNAGAALANEGRLVESRAHYEEALAILAELRDQQWSGIVLGNLAEVLHELGEPEQARALFERALDAYRRTGDRAFMGSTLCDVGAFHWELGELESARACLVDAIELLRATSRPGFTGHALAMLGAIEAHRGRLDAATRALDEAAQILGACDDPVHRVVLDACRGHLEIARGGDARAHLDALERVTLRADDIRTARRLLRRATQAPTEGPDARASKLLVHPDGRWFRPPHAPKLVDIDRRPSLRHLLVLLASHARDTPQRVVTLDALMRAGWPGEKMSLRSGTARVHVALHTLRKLGLRNVLRSEKNGYRLDPEVQILFTDRP